MQPRDDQLHNRVSCNEDIVKWLAGSQRFICVYGGPRAGKPILSSFLIDDICQRFESGKAYICIYYYCSYKRKSDETLGLLRWIVSQLCRRLGSVEPIPVDLLKLNELNHEPDIESLKIALERLLFDYEGVYLVVDAVDQSVKPRDNLLDLFEAILRHPPFSKIQLLITSRECADIESRMANFSTTLSMATILAKQDTRPLWRVLKTE
jgi:hypothetical protein